MDEDDFVDGGIDHVDDDEELDDDNADVDDDQSQTSRYNIYRQDLSRVNISRVNNIHFNTIFELPRPEILVMLEDGSFQEEIKNISDDTWKLYANEGSGGYFQGHHWNCCVHPDLSTVHVQCLNLVLAKLSGGVRLSWTFHNRGKNAFASFDQDAFCALAASLANAPINFVLLEMFTPKHCERLMLEGVGHIVSASRSLECLYFYGEDMICDVGHERPLDANDKYLQFFRGIMSDVDLIKTGASLKEINMTNFNLQQITCQELLNFLSRMPQIVHFHAGRIDFIDDGQPLGLEQAYLLRDFRIRFVYLAPESFSSLLRVLACVSQLESLDIVFQTHLFHFTSAESNSHQILRLIQELKVTSLSICGELDVDFNLEDIFDALRDNKYIKKLTLVLTLKSDFRRDLESPHGWDWLFYTKCRLMSKALEESNVTLTEVDFIGCFGPLSHLYHKEFDTVRYWTALNHYGRKEIREGSHDLAELLSTAQEKIGVEDEQYKIDFASVAYGLVKESVSMHGDIRSRSSCT